MQGRGIADEERPHSLFGVDQLTADKSKLRFWRGELGSTFECQRPAVIWGIVVKRIPRNAERLRLSGGRARNDVVVPPVHRDDSEVESAGRMPHASCKAVLNHSEKERWLIFRDQRRFDWLTAIGDNSDGFLRSRRGPKKRGPTPFPSFS